MTVAASTSRTSPLACNGSVTGFTFTFGVNATSEIQVILTSAAGVETVLTETTHYTVSATNSDYSSGGTVTTVSTYASGYTITVLRNVPLTQESDFTEGMPTLYETFENSLDKLTRIDQQQQEQIARTPKVQKSSSLSDIIIQEGPGKYLRWNDAGDGITCVPLLDPDMVTYSWSKTDYPSGIDFTGIDTSLLPMRQVFFGFSPGDITGLTLSRPEYFGGVPGSSGNGTTNATAIACAIASLSTGGVFELAPATYYNIAGSEAVVFDKPLIVRFNGSYLDYGTGTGTGVRFGGASGTSFTDIAAYDVEVRGTGNGTAIVVQNLARSRFYNVNAQMTGATGTALKMTTLVSGTYFLDFYGAKLFNSHKNLVIDMDANAASYLNNISFYGGDIYGTLPTPAGSRGIEIGDTNIATRPVSSIHFIGTNIEPLTGTGTGRKAYIAGGTNIHFDGCNWEQPNGAPGYDIEFTSTSQYCSVTGDYTVGIQRILDSQTDVTKQAWIAAPGYGLTTGKGQFQARATDAYFKFDSSGVFTEGVYPVRREHFSQAALADDGTVNLGTAGTPMFALVTAQQDGGNGAEACLYMVGANGVTQKISGTANTAATDSDGNLCLYAGGAQVVAKNRLGYAATITVTMIFY